MFSVQGNPNFIPLHTDWRVRVQAAREAAILSKASMTTPVATNTPLNDAAMPRGSTTVDVQAAVEPSHTPSTVTVTDDEAPLHFDKHPDLSVLSRGLPPGWDAMWDATTGDVYYGKLSTQVEIPCLSSIKHSRR